VQLLVNWLFSALALIIVAHVAPGFYVRDLLAALAAAAVIGLINATLGLLLKILTAPLTLVTFGAFLLVINALMLMLASSILRGFEVRGFWAALIGSIALSLVNLGLRAIRRASTSPPRPRR
jgi:putative membrane protein